MPFANKPRLGQATGVLLLLLLGASGLNARAQSLLVGAAKVEITPDSRLTNWIGHQAYTGVLDPLFVHALAVDDGTNEFLLLAYDLVDTREPFVARVRRAVAASVPLAQSNILVHASHTHSAPWAPTEDAPLLAHERKTLRPVESDPLFQNWARHLIELSGQAAQTAHRARRPATLTIGRASVPEPLFNRRPRRPDGTVQTTFEPTNPNVLPGGQHFGPMDPTLTVLSFRAPDQVTIATLFHLPCHPVTVYPYHQGLSGDWPAAVSKRLEQAVGGIAIFLQGCAGDIVPARRGIAGRDAMAELVAKRALDAITLALPLTNPAVKVRRSELELPLTPAARADTGRDHFTSEVQVLAIGTLGWVALPGEPLTDLGTELQRRSSFQHTLVLGYAGGGGVQYVGMPGEKARGGYEMSEAGAGADICGELLVDAATQLMQSLAPDLVSRVVPRETAFLSTGHAPQVITTPQANPTPTNRFGRLKLLSKEILFRNPAKRPFVPGFVTYLSATQPLLIHCFGREDYSDGYDDYAVAFSSDNGRTWTEPEVRWKSKLVPEGRIRYAEPAAYFDDDRQKLVVLVDRTLYPKDQLNVDADYTLELNLYDPATGTWTKPRALTFPGQRSPAMSFSVPIKTVRGRLLFPGMRKTVDANGRAIHYRGGWAPVDEMVAVLGDWTAQGDISWQLGRPLTIAPELSSRGLDENTVIELPDGAIAAVCRGDNSAFPDRPGHKWLSFSRDHGETWSGPVPLPATSGPPLESGANGSALFRSIRNGRLYWMGNLALRGERPNGNWPRAPLVIVEVQLDPFALRNDTLFVVDEHTFNDSPKLQLSNFRFYQDRDTADVVIFLTRYGEHSEKEWMDADYYRYRVQMP